MPVGDALRPKSSDGSPGEVRQSGAGQLDLAWSDDDRRCAPVDRGTSRRRRPKSPGAFSPSNKCAAEATLVFAGATVAAFDDRPRRLIETLARRAGVSPDRVSITNYRAGSLVVDCRIEFPEEAHARASLTRLRQKRLR